MTFKPYVPGRMTAEHAHWSRELCAMGHGAQTIAALIGVPTRSVQNAVAGRTFKTHCPNGTDRFAETIDANLLWYTRRREVEPE